MAILKNGLWGGITGKLGNTVCYMVKGKQVVRMIVKSDKPPTQRQLDNWTEMAMVNKFLRPLKEVIRIGYGPMAKGGNASAFNLAVSHTKKHALEGEVPNRRIDYSKVLISQGGLTGLLNAGVLLDGNMLRLSWLTELHLHAESNDQVMVLAYFPPVGPGLAPFVLMNRCGVDRCLGQDVLQLPEEMQGRSAEVYIFVLSANGKEVSDSEYVGKVP